MQHLTALRFQSWKKLEQPLSILRGFGFKTVALSQRLTVIALFVASTLSNLIACRPAETM